MYLDKKLEKRATQRKSSYVSYETEVHVVSLASFGFTGAQNACVQTLCLDHKCVRCVFHLQLSHKLALIFIYVVVCTGTAALGAYRLRSSFWAVCSEMSFKSAE